MAAKRKPRGKEYPCPKPHFWPPIPADATCQLTRTVVRNGVTLALWTCSRPSLTLQGRRAYRFDHKYTQRWWPGSLSGWYDAVYFQDRSCFPGRTQYVVYQGGRRSRRTR